MIRSATLEDVDRVVALVESAYRGEKSRAGWTTEADMLEGQRTDAREVRAIIEAFPKQRVLLLEEEGALRACARLDDAEGHAYLGMIAVDPTLQAKGYGRSIIAEAERIARTELGQHAVHMTVISIRAELIAWYERLGYVRTGATEPFPYGDERFGVPKRDDLAFVVLEKQLQR
jgi:ribosomal protein S18 acetylase RimI-like enzyme